MKLLFENEYKQEMKDAEKLIMEGKPISERQYYWIKPLLFQYTPQFREKFKSYMKAMKQL